MKRIVSYDVVSDRTRAKVHKLLKDYGQWMQYSLFELEISDEDWLILEHRLAKLLEKEDTLCVYALCQSCSQKANYWGNLIARIEEAKNNIL